MEYRSTGENAYFAASNSEKGFCSYYKECFDASRIGYVYAIKGGPGTGKSRFMREVAQYAQKKGWAAEYIYCSSDADSLDGVILTNETEGIALLDATAPHVYEPTLPGVREELINLGAFWNREKLLANGREIALLNRKKSEAYRNAYRYLSSEGKLMESIEEMVSPYLRRDAIQAYAEKQVRDLEAGGGYESRPALLHSVGMQGEVIFDTYFASAAQCFFLEDCYGAAQIFLETVGEMALKKGWKIRVSHDPVYPNRLDGIFLTDSRRAFVIKPKGIAPACRRVLSLRRFVEVSKMRPFRGKLQFALRLKNAMRQGALDALREVKEIHFALESLYIDAMDFEAKEFFTKRFCEQLF